jgi:hypothetical protein
MTDENTLEDIEIKLPDEETPEKPADAPEDEPVVSKPETKTVDPEAALEDLRGQIEAHKQAVAQERAAREEAERRARESQVRADQYDAEAKDGRLTAITNAIRAANVESDQAEKMLADALEQGDHKAVAKLQRFLSQNEAKLLQLENGKSILEDRLKTPQREQPVTRRNDDPVEAWANTLSAPAASWVRSHRDVVSDPVKMKKIGAAHQSAVELEGIQPDTPEYFAYIESKLGMREPEPAPRPATSQKKPVPAVPVSPGSGSSLRRGENGSIILSVAERDHAHYCYPDLSHAKAEERYAADKVAMQRAGRM